MTNTETLHKNGIFLFQGDFTNTSCKEAIEFIVAKNIEEELDEIKLMICSNGGIVPDTFALIDVIRGSKIPVTTVGLGIISSCGVFTFMSGHKRILTTNTSILSHQYSWGTTGKAHELLAANKEFQLAHERIVKHYQKCTKLKRKEIEKYLLPPHDVWLTPKEAIKFGIADEIKDVW